MLTDEQIYRYKFGTEDTAGIIFFGEEQIITEQGKSLIWEDWQKEIWNDIFLPKDERGLRQYNSALIGVGKKNGKSFMAACFSAHQLLFCDDDAPAEVYSIAGDKDQASIIFEKCKVLLQANPELRSACKFYHDAIETRAGGVYRVLAADAGFRTAHGLNPSALVIDEAWVFKDDAPWTALTFSPVRKQPIYFIISYGGFDDNDDALLMKLRQAGEEGTNEQMYYKWFEGENGSYEGWKKANPASWVDERYLAQQKKALINDNAFRRMHLCQSTSSESQFLSRSEWDACVDASLRPFEGNRKLRIVAGLDASVRRDYTACVAVAKVSKSRFRIACHRIWQPKKKDIVFDEVERYVSSLAKNFRLDAVYFDPYQFAASAQRLRRRGVKMIEYPQTAANLTRSGSALYENAKDGNLLAYDDEDIRKAVLNCAVKESERGWRIIKRGSGKIDAAVALSFALVGAEDLPISNSYGLSSVSCIAGRMKTGCPIFGTRSRPSSDCMSCRHLFKLWKQIRSEVKKGGHRRMTVFESVASYAREHPEVSEGIGNWATNVAFVAPGGNDRGRVRRPALPFKDGIRATYRNVLPVDDPAFMEKLERRE